MVEAFVNARATREAQQHMPTTCHQDRTYPAADITEALEAANVLATAVDAWTVAQGAAEAVAARVAATGVETANKATCPRSTQPLSATPVEATDIAARRAHQVRVS